MSEQPTRSCLPIGTPVRLCSPGAWFDGKTGRVHHYPDEWPERVTVELDGDEPRALVHHEDIRVRSADRQTSEESHAK